MNRDLESLQDTYEILGQIGKGGGGSVYKAYHKRLRMYVVIKKIHNKVAAIINTRAEADILKNLKSPYLPKVLDYIEVNGNVFTVMEFIPGKSLQQCLNEGMKFSQRDVIKWSKQLCEAVAYLHGRKPAIIHSDIKPDNIMLLPSGDICLIDFNVSLLAANGKAMVTGITDGYSPPEQYPDSYASKKYAYIDCRADIYSMGATMYHLLMGWKPEISLKYVMAMHPLDSMKISDGMIYIVNKAMEKNPSKRFKSASDMLKVLNKIGKLDKRYKRYRLKQEITYILLTVLLFGSVITVKLGIETLGREKNEKYNSLIKQAVTDIDEQNYDMAESKCNDAIELYNDKNEAYYYNLLVLYKQADYEEGIKYANENIISNEKLTDDYYMAETYYVLGNCYFEIENYELSSVYFDKALKINKDKSVYYRDYAVSLAREQKIDQAEKVIALGIESDVDDVDLSFTYSEIEYIKGNYSKTCEYAEKVIESADDDYIKMRAYYIKSKALKELSAAHIEKAKENIELLEEAITELPEEYIGNILNMLAQAYIDTGENGKAVSIIDGIIENGWGTYSLWNTKGILYQKDKDYENALNTYTKMLDMFGEKYEIYKRMALVEAESQMSVKNTDRNYSTFREYYEKAKVLYSRQNNGRTDAEMQVLENLYNEISSGGWFE